jgi:two-component system OmpR family sensor kinase
LDGAACPERGTDSVPSAPRERYPAEAGRIIQELRAALRARDEFLSVAAHELRNPLTPITMQVAMLLRAARAADPPLPPGIVAQLERLELATRRFLKRATVLLDVSRLAAGHPFRPEVARFDLSALVLEVAADHTPVAARVRSALDTSAVEPDVAGAWDRVGVELILDNLLSNALKHGAGAPVQVGLARTTGNGEARVRLWVQDEGPGVAPEDHERIFTRFEQARDRRAAAGGFGVGLWVAREVARGMGGEIQVESRPGAGATFSLVAPLDVAAHLEAAERAGRQA